MNILILGGTIFLGRHLVPAALERGHRVTLFNRGRHNPELFPEVEKIHGDRATDLDLLKGRTWDAVIDTCGYIPRVVRASAEALKDAVGHYTFISSISVYSDNSKPGMDESAPVGRLEDETVEEVTGETYGPLKALCEQGMQEIMGGRGLNIRPGLIVGPDDPSDRFTYWPLRAARGGEILAPGDPEAPVQIIDVRDLAEWTLSMVEQGKSGDYNATGPDYTLTMRAILEECVAASDVPAGLTWVPDEFLLRHNVGQWMELPLWIADDESTKGFSRTDCSRAIGDGLTFRPLSAIVADTLAWARKLPADRAPRAGMAPEREK